MTAYLCDEQGKPSSARVFLLWGVTLTTVVVLAVVIFERQPDNALWAVLSTWLVAGASWAGGPRLAQYLAPQLGAAAQAAASAARSAIAKRREQGKEIGAEPT